MRFVSGKLYSGGKDGNMNVISIQTHEVENSINFGSVLIRAIDVMGTNALVGMRDGTIYTVDLNTSNKKSIMESHSDGEVWGLTIPNDDLVLTTCDDN